MNVMSKRNCLQQYHWGENCTAWNFVDDINLSVKLENMPPGSSESRHLHMKARQFFFIIKGQATIEIENEILLVKEGEGIFINPNQKHRIYNRQSSELEFLLTSQPTTNNDRIKY